MTAYKDEERGTWFANFRYKDWRGKSKQKSKRGFRTKREAQAWERDFKKKMSRAASMELSLACDIYLKDNAPRVRETTLEQKRYYIEQILKPYFEGMLVGDIDAKAVIDWENHLLESRTKRGTPYTATYLNALCSQLSAIMNHLVRFYGLERNPMQIAGKVGSKKKRDSESTNPQVLCCHIQPRKLQSAPNYSKALQTTPKRSKLLQSAPNYLGSE